MDIELKLEIQKIEFVFRLPQYIIKKSFLSQFDNFLLVIENMERKHFRGSIQIFYTGRPKKQTLFYSQ